MALFVNQNSNRTKLQEQLAAELQAKAKKRAEVDTTRPDGVEDSPYLNGTKKTTSLAWVWLLLAVIVVGLIIFLTIKAQMR